MSLILVVNPGSTSTKLAIYDDLKQLVVETIRHDPKELLKFKTINSQKNYRLLAINNFLKQNNYQINDFKCLAVRGGLVKSVSSGTYLVNQNMYKDLMSGKYGEHASNLGGIIGYEYSKKNKINAYIVDPVVVDEQEPIAKISGSKFYEKHTIFHALNQKSIAKKYANDIKKDYNKLCLIVAHMGGGITIGLHKNGKVVDVNNGLGGLGPYSPERAGSLDPFSVVDRCFKSKKTINEIKKEIVGQGGLISYLNTSNLKDIEERINKGDKEAEFYIRGMAYQVIKEIGSLYFIASGKVDCILLTGGLTYGKNFMNYLTSYLDKLNTKYKIYYGEDEMLALAEGVYHVLIKKEKIKKY